MFYETEKNDHGLPYNPIKACVVPRPIGWITSMNEDGLVNAAPAITQSHVLLIALCVAVLSTALPYTLEMVALPRLPTQTFGTLMSLEPAFGALSGLLFLGQALSLLQWLAIMAVITASIGTTVTGRSAEPIEAPYPD